MREIVQKLVQEDLPSMLTWVLAGNPSREFYEKLGGKQIAEKEVLIGGVKLPALAYGWRDVRVILERM